MKYGRYGYTSYQRPRPLAPDTNLQRPLALGYPFSAPPGVVIAGPLGKKTKKEKKAERQARDLNKQNYIDRLEDAKNKLQTLIQQLTQGLVASTANIDIETPTVPAGVKLTPRMKKLRREIDKLKTKHLSAALREAQLREQAKKAEDDMSRDRDDVKWDDDTIGWGEDDSSTGPPAGNGNTPPPAGDPTFPTDDVANQYYGGGTIVPPSPISVQVQPAGFGATEEEVDEGGNVVTKSADWIIYAGSIVGSIAALWGVYEWMKRRKKR